MICCAGKNLLDALANELDLVSVVVVVLGPKRNEAGGGSEVGA